LLDFLKRVPVVGVKCRRDESGLPGVSPAVKHLLQNLKDDAIEVEDPDRLNTDSQSRTARSSLTSTPKQLKLAGKKVMLHVQSRCYISLTTN
jgi:hypothetical protein